MKSDRKPIIVVGSINIDLVATAQRIPIVGETVAGQQFYTYPGGKGANQAVTIARLGYPVQMIGRLGADSFGEQLRLHLDRVGVGLTGVEPTESASGVAVIVVDPQGENCIVVIPGANAHVTPEYVDSHWHLVRNAGLVLAQLEIPLETVGHLARRCSHEGIPLILDPAPAQALPSDLLRHVNWFTPNETEAAFYIANGAGAPGSDAPGQIARLLLAQGPAGVVVKMGSRGAYLATTGIDQHLSAITVEAVDTTAAGDAFNGAFAVGLMLNKSSIESANFGMAAAAISVTRSGAQSSMPSFSEVEGMLNACRSR